MSTVDIGGRSKNLSLGRQTPLAYPTSAVPSYLILTHEHNPPSWPSKENVHRHALRMLLHLHHKVLPSLMETLMKTLEPPKQVGPSLSLSLSLSLPRSLLSILFASLAKAFKSKFSHWYFTYLSHLSIF